MKYRFTYKVEPFADTFNLTIRAPYHEEAVRLWKKSILSYHAILINVQEVEDDQ